MRRRRGKTDMHRMLKRMTMLTWKRLAMPRARQRNMQRTPVLWGGVVSFGSVEVWWPWCWALACECGGASCSFGSEQSAVIFVGCSKL